jgi:uncharacterized membrane protein YfcA
MLSNLSLLLEPDLLAALLGIVVGLIVGLSGAGGGIIAVPLLVFGLNLPMNMAAPVGLIAVGLSASLGAALGLREGIVRYRAALLIGLFGMGMAPFGVWLAQRIPNAPLQITFSVVLLYTAWRMLRQAGQAAPDDEECRGQPCRIDPNAGRLLWTLPCARALAGTGLLSGLLSGLLGVGGGFVIVPALGKYTDLKARSVVATSLAVMALVALGGVAAAALQGSVRWAVAVPFSAGALFGLLLGQRISRRVAGTRLQQTFAVVCVLAAVLLLARGFGWLGL